MSTKPETTFYRSVHDHLPKRLYRVKMSNPYVGGVPDIWYSGHETDLWVEFKFVKLPAKPLTTIDFGFSKLQLDWMNGRHADGRSVWGIIGCKDGGVVLKNGTWNRTNVTKQEFVRAIRTRKQLAEEIEQFVGWWPERDKDAT